MSTTYTLCKRLITLGMTNGLQDKLDVFFAMDRLSMQEYTELAAELMPAEPAPEPEGGEV